MLISVVFADSEKTKNQRKKLKNGNMGRTVVESLAMGTPVIATTYPGLKNLVSDRLNGAVIETKNPSALARALAQVGEGDWSREAIRGTVPHEYTLDGMMDQLLDVYQLLICLVLAATRTVLGVNWDVEVEY